MKAPLPPVVVANFHRRFTGVSATVKTLVPLQRNHLDVGVADRGRLGLGGEWSLARIAVAGFGRPAGSEFRVWHARRHSEMIIGILLRDLLRQRWKLLFTQASGKSPSWLTKILIGRMDAVVAVSEIARKARAEEAVVVHHGIDCMQFCPQDDPLEAPAADRFPGKRVIGLVGWVRPKKGTDHFVEAMIQVLPEFPDCVAVIAGACRPRHREFREHVESRIRSSGLGERIAFLGQLDHSELPSLYREMAICAAPSRHEGFGLTVLEALACGTPVVATRTGAWPEILDDEVGALIDIGDSDALADELRSMLSDPQRLQAMGNAARVRAVARHSRETEADSLVCIYRSLMSGSDVRNPAGLNRSS